MMEEGFGTDAVQLNGDLSAEETDKGGDKEFRMKRPHLASSVADILRVCDFVCFFLILM